MKFFQFMVLVLLMLVFTACSTHRGAGGYYDENLTSGVQSSSLPPASPTMRPGMTPEDPRDPQYITRPQPLEPAPTTKP